MDSLPKELLLKTSLKKQLFLISICVAFVAIGIWMIGDGEWFGWAAVIFFGTGIPLLTIQMIKGGGYLRINDEGIAMGTARKEETKYRWEDIEEFGIVKISGNKFVSWNFRPHYNKSKLTRKFNLGIGAMEAMLPDTYGFKAIDLMTLLNEYKENHALHSTEASSAEEGYGPDSTPLDSPCCQV